MNRPAFSEHPASDVHNLESRGLEHLLRRLFHVLGHAVLVVSELIEKTQGDRKSTRLNSSHGYISYAVFCLKKKKNQQHHLSQLLQQHALGQSAPLSTQRSVSGTHWHRRSTDRGRAADHHPRLRGHMCDAHC